MSDAVDVVVAVDALIVDVDALLESATLEVVIDLVDGLGGGLVISELFADLSRLLGEARGQLDRLIAAVDEPLRHIRALGGLLGLLGPLIGGLQCLVQLSGEQLADAGLDEVLTVSEPLTGAIAFGGDVLAGGEEILTSLPSRQDLDRLRDHLDGLIETVDKYAAAADRSAA